ncbi:MAG: tetratricopeptide repeat protein [Candidatus Heimdallarchaeaceae archaeon]
MLTFVEPYVMKYKFYKTYTSFYNVQGAMHSFMGDNTKAMDCFNKLKKIHETYHDEYRLSIAIGNLAEVYMVVGRVKKAKEMMEKAIELYKKSTNQWPYLYLTEIGNIYFLLGDERAEESFLHAYEIQRKEKSIHKAFIMYELVHFYLRKESLDETKKYLQELRSLAKDLEIPSIFARVDYLRGFYEILEHNFKNGIEYLQASLEQAKRTKDMELILFCNIQLTIANLWYYRLLEKQEFLNYALTYINNVRHLAIENNHNGILTTSLVICSILYAVNGEYEESMRDIKQAREIGKEVDYQNIQEYLNEIQESIQNAKDTGVLDLREKNIIEYTLPQFKNLLSLKLVQTKKKDVEILGILIISESGIPIYSKLKDKLKANDLLLSGLLMAINQLAESILEGEEVGKLRDVNYEDFCITLQGIKNGIIAVIASEVRSEVRMWSLSLAEKIKEVPPVVTKFVSTVPDKIAGLLEQVNL